MHRVFNAGIFRTFVGDDIEGLAATCVPAWRLAQLLPHRERLGEAERVCFRQTPTPHLPCTDYACADDYLQRVGSRILLFSD